MNNVYLDIIMHRSGEPLEKQERHTNNPGTMMCHSITYLYN